MSAERSMELKKRRIHCETPAGARIVKSGKALQILYHCLGTIRLRYTEATACNIQGMSPPDGADPGTGNRHLANVECELSKEALHLSTHTQTKRWHHIRVIDGALKTHRLGGWGKPVLTIQAKTPEHTEELIIHGEGDCTTLQIKSTKLSRKAGLHSLPEQ